MALTGKTTLARYLPTMRGSLFIGAYCALSLAACYLTQRAGLAMSICPLKTLSGIPCPSCGATRAALALLEGNFCAALVFNPLAVGLYLLGPPAGLCYLRFPRLRAWKLRIPRLALWIPIGAAIAANWAYLLLAGR